MSKKRAERVKEKLFKQRQARIKERQEKAAHERLAYQNRKRQTPIIKRDDTILQRNNKKLLEMAADHEALLKFREENKEKHEEQFEALKKEQTELAEKLNEARNDGRTEQDDRGGVEEVVQ